MELNKTNNNYIQDIKHTLAQARKLIAQISSNIQ